MQQLLTAGTRLFARKTEMERRYFPPLTGPDGGDADRGRGAGDGAAAQRRHLNLFDLSMWAARPRTTKTGAARRPCTTKGGNVA